MSDPNSIETPNDTSDDPAISNSPASENPDVAASDGVASVPDYIARMYTERDDLRDRIGKANDFTNTQRFIDLPLGERDVYVEQVHYMDRYLDALIRRTKMCCAREEVEYRDPVEEQAEADRKAAEEAEREREQREADEAQAAEDAADAEASKSDDKGANSVE